MIFEREYNDIINSFGTVWGFKERGETLEIITPFATITQKFISVFLSKRKDSYIISDGGWISDMVYNNCWNIEADCFNKIFFHYYNSFDIKEVKTGTTKSHFYKKTNNEIAVPSFVLDVSNFIIGIVNASIIDYQINQGNNENYKMFRGIANDYISSLVPKNKLDTQGYLDKNDKAVRVNAVIQKTPSKIILVNYITGSNTSHFTTSIARTNLMFEMADKSKYRDYIDKKISLVDDTAAGYTPASDRLNFTLNNTNSIRVDWSNKDEFRELLN